MKEEYLKNAVLNYKDDILHPFNELIDIIGFDGIYLLTKEMSGSSLYIPNINKIFKKCLYQQIPKEFDGSNYRQLCKRYNLTERTIRTIIEDHNKKINHAKV